jgi:zinc transporter
LRRKTASIRRYLAPQRDALDRLYRQPGDLFSQSEAQSLREEADRITRYLEDLDLARERAMVLQEELLGRMAHEQNSRMYLLSVVAAVFLPLSFLTGLLGMNVAGLPGTENPQAFALSAIAMIGLGIGLVVYFRWKRWI